MRHLAVGSDSTPTTDAIFYHRY